MGVRLHLRQPRAPRRARRALIAASCIAAMGACASGSGEDGTNLLVPYDELGGGIVFATNGITGSNGYDLYWIPFPDTRSRGLLPFARLTDAQGDEWQPSVARSGKGIAFARENQIFVISNSGRIRQITDNSDTSFADSLPALSPNADRVAWVREDTNRPIEGTTFFETFVMMANFDGTNIIELSPKPGVIQDAPAFDPKRDATRVAWSEFTASSLAGKRGPLEYGLFIYDFAAATGFFACQAVNGSTPGGTSIPRDWPFRCFGQHLQWPVDDVLVLAQDLLEVHLDGSGLASIWTPVVEGIQKQQTGFPDIAGRSDGFFPAFPISVHYTPDTTRIVFDGVMHAVDGDLAEWSMFTAMSNGDAAFRIEVSGLSAHLDTVNTHSFLFSVGTPQLIPIQVN